MSNKKTSAEHILISAFVGVESAHAFSAFEPSVFTIQGLAVPQEQEYMIRRGYIPSVAFSTLLGGIVSALIKSKLPILFGLGTSAFMIATYEIAIRSAPVPSTRINSVPNCNRIKRWENNEQDFQQKNYGIVISRAQPVSSNPQSR